MQDTELVREIGLRGLMQTMREIHEYVNFPLEDRLKILAHDLSAGTVEGVCSAIKRVIGVM